MLSQHHTRTRRRRERRTAVFATALTIGAALLFGCSAWRLL